MLTFLDIEQIPLSQISEDVYKTSIDWLNQRSFDALGSFVLWSLDSILADLVQHQGASKGSKKVVQQVPSKSQVCVLSFLHVILRVLCHVWCGYMNQPLLSFYGDGGKKQLHVCYWN